MKTKICKDCGSEKPEDMFVKRGDKRGNICKACHAAAERKRSGFTPKVIFKPGMKICSRCSFEGAEELFRKGRNWCLLCARSWSRENRLKHPKPRKTGTNRKFVNN